MDKKFGFGTVKDILIRLGIILTLIGMITFATLFYVIKLQIESRQKEEVFTVTELITQAIQTSKDAAATFERLVDLRLYAISKAIGSELSGRAASTISREELVQLKEKWNLYDLSLFVKSDSDIVVIQSSDPKEVGLSSKDWGYWFTAFQQLFALRLVDVGEGFSKTHYWVGPLSKSEIYDEPFKYAYYYDGTTDFIINPYISDAELQELVADSGTAALIEKMVSSSNHIAEVAVVNIVPYLKDGNAEIIEPHKDLPVMYGQHRFRLKEDRSIFESALHNRVRTSVTFDEQGKEYEKVYVSLSENRILTIVMDRSELSAVVAKLLLIMAVIYCIAFVCVYLFAKKLNKRSLAMLNRMNRLAYFDELTQLPNRNHCIERMEATFSIVHENTKNAIMAIDLDNFKNVNDTLGHSAGDQLLNIVAERMLGQLNGRGFLARMGGDEFIVLLPIRESSDAAEAAAGLLSCMEKPIVMESQEFIITLSIGISIFPQDGLDANTLLKHADMALYNEKNKEKNNFSFFSTAMQINALQKLDLQDHMRKSLNQGHFVLYYQPQVDLSTNRVSGFEALVRWNHPVKGMISPAEFIPVAEESGMIVPLGEWILQEACRQFKQLLDNGLPQTVRLSVNLSARQFKQIDLLDKIQAILESTGVSPESLILEITESTSMMNIDYSIEVLTQLRNRGVKIAIDDFGTGYSSLRYLNLFPIHYLKIDHSFMQNIFVDVHAETVVKSILDLANNLHLKVTAEGVETLQHMQYLKQYGCDEVQGYYIGHPMELQEVLSFAAQYDARKTH